MGGGGGGGGMTAEGYRGRPKAYLHVIHGFQIVN